MGELTILDKIFSLPRTVLDNIEYYFAKRWLNKNFGEQEYWGEYILSLIRLSKEQA